MKIRTAGGLERELTEFGNEHFIGFKDRDSMVYLRPEKVDEIEKRIIGYRERAQILLNQHPGHLHSYDRDALLQLSHLSLDEAVLGFSDRGEIKFSDDHLRWMFGRVKRLEEGGIPQIFSSEFESSTGEGVDIYNTGFELHRYPTLDAIINLFVKDYVPKKNRRITKAVDPEDILFFRDYAIRDEFSGQVLKELIQSTKDKYKNRFQSSETRDHVLGKVSEGFEHLKRSLSDLPSHPRFKVHDLEENSERIVARPFWYTQYTSHSVDLILADYFKGVLTSFLVSDKIDPKGFVGGTPGTFHVLDLFPDRTIDFDDWRRQKTDYLRDKIESNVDNYAVRGGNFGTVCLEIGVESDRSSGKLVGGLLDEVHLQRVSGFSDTQFVEYINGLPKGSSIAGQPRTGAYLSKRLQDLIGETNYPQGRVSFKRKAEDLGINEGSLNFARRLYNTTRIF